MLNYKLKKNFIISLVIGKWNILNITNKLLDGF